jgi:putative FmdB family regulatory protein
MVLYTWRCTVCAHEFDESISLADYDKITTLPCPECGKDAKRRLTSVNAVGSSWKHWRS